MISKSKFSFVGSDFLLVSGRSSAPPQAMVSKNYTGSLFRASVLQHIPPGAPKMDISAGGTRVSAGRIDQKYLQIDL